jgi:hypothetical protein
MTHWNDGHSHVDFVHVAQDKPVGRHIRVGSMTQSMSIARRDGLSGVPSALSLLAWLAHPRAQANTIFFLASTFSQAVCILCSRSRDCASPASDTACGPFGDLVCTSPCNRLFSRLRLRAGASSSSVKTDGWLRLEAAGSLLAFDPTSAGERGESPLRPLVPRSILGDSDCAICCKDVNCWRHLPKGRRCLLSLPAAETALGLS